MRLLLWHCKTLRYRDRDPSSRPAGIAQVIAAPAEGVYDDVVAAFVCVEERDGEREATDAAAAISTFAEQVARQDVALVPFGHLSARLMQSSAEAVRLITFVGRALESAGMKAELTSFGYHKEFELHYVAYGHLGAVAFREFPSSADASTESSYETT